MRRLRTGITVLALLTATAACAGGGDGTPLVEGSASDAGASGTAEPVDGGTDTGEQPGEPSAPSDDGTSDDATDGDGPDDDGPDGEPSPASEMPSGAPGGEPATAPDASPRCTLTDDEAGIQVTSPVEGAVVDPTFTLAGCGNTFEATYVWEVELDDGRVANGGFGTMTCGTGCVGTFEQDVTVQDTGPAVVRVFEESARDGERTNVVEVPVTVRR